MKKKFIISDLFFNQIRGDECIELDEDITQARAEVMRLFTMGALA